MSRTKATLACLVAAMIPVSVVAATDIYEMKPIKIVTGMTSITIATGTQEVFSYGIDVVGRALVQRGRGVCDFLRNTVTGSQDIQLVKADGSKVTVTLPLIEKYVETGMCEQLQKKHFQP